MPASTMKSNSFVEDKGQEGNLGEQQCWVPLVGPSPDSHEQKALGAVCYLRGQLLPKSESNQRHRWQNWTCRRVYVTPMQYTVY